MSEESGNLLTATSETIPRVKVTNDYVIKNIPVISAGLIFFGILKQSGFYLMFGINILSYMTFAEAIAFSIPFFSILILYFIFTYLVAMSVGEYIFKLASPKEDSIKRVRSQFKLFKIVTPVAGLLFFGFALFIPDPGDKTEIILLASSLLILYLVMMPLGKAIFPNDLTVQPKLTTQSLVTFFGVICLVGPVLFSIWQAAVIKFEPSDEYVEITFKNEKSLTTNANLIYVGRVQSNTFLYDRKENEPVVLTNEEIKEVRWRNKLNANEPSKNVSNVGDSVKRKPLVDSSIKK
jgi:hypothetical protein